MLIYDVEVIIGPKVLIKWRELSTAIVTIVGSALDEVYGAFLVDWFFG